MYLQVHLSLKMKSLVYLLLSDEQKMQMAMLSQEDLAAYMLAIMIM